MTIVEFLTARLAEDTKELAVAQRSWERVEDSCYYSFLSRVPAEIEAKRAIIRANRSSAVRPNPNDTLLAIAAVYADHPDFNPAWKVA
jgi:hypothetical protein